MDPIYQSQCHLPHHCYLSGMKMMVAFDAGDFNDGAFDDSAFDFNDDAFIFDAEAAPHSAVALSAFACLM